MAEISASLVKQLRDRTGAGMMECKKALTEANGNLDAAVDVLRKRGIASANKKSGRSTKQGMIGSFVSESGKLGVIAEVNCESDFVARNEDFQELVAHVSEHIAEAAPTQVRKDEALEQALADEAGHILYEQPFHQDQSVTVGHHIATKIAKIGENIMVTRFARFDAAGNGKVAVYLHPGSQLGVLVELRGADDAYSATPEFHGLAQDVAMQVAAADPQFVSRDKVTPEAIAKEKEIARDRALAEGKPEKILDKIVEGRLAKFYEEVCLVEQPFIKDNTITVAQLMAKTGQKIEVAQFARFKVGELAVDTPAAE